MPPIVVVTVVVVVVTTIVVVVAPIVVVVPPSLVCGYSPPPLPCGFHLLLKRIQPIKVTKHVFGKDTGLPRGGTRKGSCQIGGGP